MAAQEFRHTIQRPGESVAEFIRRLEKAYQVAYGKDSLNHDTREALLYSQLYDGLSYALMRGPSVSGGQNYRALCVAARGEEHRLAALHRRQQFKSPSEILSRPRKQGATSLGSQPEVPPARNTKDPPSAPLMETQVICYNCNKPGHIAKYCRRPKQESRGWPPSQQTAPKTHQVQSASPPIKQNPPADFESPTSFLYSDSDDETAHARTVRVPDEGSISQCVKVQVQGVPAYGLIDTGADITIIGGKLFKRVAIIARLKKRNFKKADRTPKTYDQRTFKLDGRMDLEVTFDGRTICTPVYIKMDAADQLLLSEGVCRQLGIVTFHPHVEKWRGRPKRVRMNGQAPLLLSQSPLVPHRKRLPWKPKSLLFESTWFTLSISCHIKADSSK